MAESTHRERKKQRTRQALVDEARRLFEHQGYEATTVAQIAAAAGVSPRTFFGYFASKDDVLHDNGAERVAAAIRVITSRAPDTPVAEVVARAIEEMLADNWTMGLVPGMTGHAVRLPVASPKGAITRSDARLDRLAGALVDAYPLLTRTGAYAVVGAALGAVSATVSACLDARHTDEQAVATAIQACRYAVAGFAVPVPDGDRERSGARGGE